MTINYLETLVQIKDLSNKYQATKDDDAEAQLNMLLDEIKENTNTLSSAQSLDSAGGFEILTAAIAKCKESSSVLSTGIRTLITMFCYETLLKNFLPVAGGTLFSHLFSFSSQNGYGSDHYLRSMEALQLLVAYAPNGYELIRDSATSAAAQARAKPFQFLVDYLGGSVFDEQLCSASLLAEVVRKVNSEGGTSHAQVIAWLCQAGIVKVLAKLEKSLGTVASMSKKQQELHAQLEVLKACLPETETESPEQGLALSFARLRFQSESLREKINRESTLNHQLKIDTIIGLTEVAEVDFNEKEMIEDLLTDVERKLVEVTSQSSQDLRATAMELEKQQRALEDERKEFERRWKAMEERMSQGEEKTRQELEELRATQEPLLAKVKAEQLLNEQQKYLRQHEQMWRFYRVLQLKLNELLLAFKVINSGRVEATDLKSKTQTVVDMGIRLAGEFVPFPGVRAAAFITVSAMAWYRKSKREKQSKERSCLSVTVADAEAITEGVSRVLAHRYEEQLMQCTVDGADVLAECAVRRMLEAIGANSVCALDSTTTNEKIIDELLENLTTIESRLAKPLKEKKIDTIERLSWNEASVFCKPGLRTEDDQFFSGATTRPKKYGYRAASVQEVKSSGLHRDHQRVVPESRSYKTLPNTHMRQKTGLFNTLQQQSSGSVGPRTLFGAPNSSSSSPALFTSSASPVSPMSISASSVSVPSTVASVSRQYPAPSPALAAAYAAANSDPFVTPVKRSFGPITDSQTTVASFTGRKEDQRLFQMQALLVSMDANFALLNQQLQKFSQIQAELDALQLAW